MLQEPARTVMVLPTQITIIAALCSQLWQTQSGEALLKQSEIEADSLSE